MPDSACIHELVVDNNPTMVATKTGAFKIFALTVGFNLDMMDHNDVVISVLKKPDCV